MSRGGVSALAVPPFVAPKWYPIDMGGQGGGIALVVSQLYVWPWVDVARRIDQFAMNSTAAVAGATCRIGVYADVAGLPDGGTLLASTGDMSGAAVAVVAAAITGGPVTVPAVRWIALLTGATAPTISVRSQLSLMTWPCPQDNPNFGSGARTAAVGGGVLPANCPATVGLGENQPTLQVRAA